METVEHKRGRPPIGNGKMEKLTITIDQERIDYLRQLGDGYVSIGVRRAVDLLKDQRITK